MGGNSCFFLSAKLDRRTDPAILSQSRPYELLRTTRTYYRKDPLPTTGKTLYVLPEDPQ